MISVPCFQDPAFTYHGGGPSNWAGQYHGAPPPNNYYPSRPPPRRSKSSLGFHYEHPNHNMSNSYYDDR